MVTNGITKVEMETMESIQSLAGTALEIKKELAKQNNLLEKLIESIQGNRKE